MQKGALAKTKAIILIGGISEHMKQKEAIKESEFL